MYSLNMPVSAIRTKVRQEFEKHRYVSQLQVVDVLLFQSHAEFQVSTDNESKGFPRAMDMLRVIGASIHKTTSALNYAPLPDCPILLLKYSSSTLY